MLWWPITPVAALLCAFHWEVGGQDGEGESVISSAPCKNAKASAVSNQAGCSLSTTVLRIISSPLGHLICLGLSVD